MAAVIQFTGATLFSISTILAVPGVLPPESSTYFAVWDATFWTLQVGGFHSIPPENLNSVISTPKSNYVLHEHATLSHSPVTL